MTNRAVIYTRHTSRYPGNSVARAKAERCRDMAQELDAEVVQEFTDHGVSGTRRTRHGFGRVLQFIAQKPVDYVICAKLSDLGRQYPSAIDLAVKINDCGAQLAIADQNIVFQVDRGHAGHGEATDPRDGS